MTQRYLQLLCLLFIFSCEPREEPQELLLACVEANYNSVQVGVPFQFKSCSKNAISFRWKFNDIISEEENPIITFTAPGKIEGSLTVADINGDKAIRIFNVTVDGKVGTALPLSTCSDDLSSFNFKRRNNENFFLSYVKQENESILRLYNIPTIPTAIIPQPKWRITIPGDLEYLVWDMMPLSDGSTIIYRNNSRQGNRMVESYRIDGGGVITDEAVYGNDTIDYNASAFLEHPPFVLYVGQRNEKSLWVSKTAATGEVVKEFKYDKEGFDIRGRHIFSTSDGYLVIANMESQTPSGRYAFMTLKLNFDLDLQWQKVYEIDEFYGVQDAVMGDDGNIYMLISHGWPISYAFFAVDPNGNELDRKVLDDHTKGDAPKNMLYHKGALYFVSVPEVIKTDLSGNFVWRRLFKTNYFRAYGHGDNILLSGYEFTHKSPCSNEQLLDPIFCELDENGQVLE